VILLDTNVLSAVMRDPPDAVVVGWLDRQDPVRLWTSAITVFEIRFGLTRLSAGRRRMALEAAFDALLREDRAGRIAVFDQAAAEAAGRLAAHRQAAGRAVDIRDTQIAGIALARQVVIATRNLRHFDDVETGRIDPWAGATMSLSRQSDVFLVFSDHGI
jgi:predicted nucleic acid-binding protein